MALPETIKAFFIDGIDGYVKQLWFKKPNKTRQQEINKIIDFINLTAINTITEKLDEFLEILNAVTWGCCCIACGESKLKLFMINALHQAIFYEVSVLLERQKLLEEALNIAKNNIAQLDGAVATFTHEVSDLRNLNDEYQQNKEALTHRAQCFKRVAQLTAVRREEDCLKQFFASTQAETVLSTSADQIPLDQKSGCSPNCLSAFNLGEIPPTLAEQMPLNQDTGCLQHFFTQPLPATMAEQKPLNGEVQTTYETVTAANPRIYR